MKTLTTLAALVTVTGIGCAAETGSLAPALSTSSLQACNDAAASIFDTPPEGDVFPLMVVEPFLAFDLDEMTGATEIPHAVEGYRTAGRDIVEVEVRDPDTGRWMMVVVNVRDVLDDPALEPGSSVEIDLGHDLPDAPLATALCCAGPAEGTLTLDEYASTVFVDAEATSIGTRLRFSLELPSGQTAELSFIVMGVSSVAL